MQQYLFWGGTQAERADKVTTTFPVNDYLYHHLTPTTSLKIADLRTLTPLLSLTSNRPRLVWLEEAQTLTLPAQHALLKTLEEPPTHVTFVLTLPSLRQVLPTVASRCQITHLKTSSPPTLPPQLEELKRALSLNPGERIAFAQSLGRSRPNLLSYFDNLSLGLASTLQTTSQPRQLDLLTRLLELTLKTQAELAKNVHTGLAVESFFLSLPTLGK